MSFVELFQNTLNNGGESRPLWVLDKTNGYSVGSFAKHINDHKLPREEKLVAAVELSENLSNVSVMIAGDVNVDTVKEMGFKESQCVDEISLGKSFENMGKESENQSLHDEFSLHVPILDSVITEKKSSESAANSDEKSESESSDPFHLQLPLIEPSSKDTKGDECAEIGESAWHGQLPMVNDFVLHVKNSDKMNMESFLEDPFKETHILLLKRLHAMCTAIDQSRLNALASKEAEDPLEEPIVSSSMADNVKVFAKQLMTLLEEETRLKASYDDWHLRFEQHHTKIHTSRTFLYTFFLNLACNRRNSRFIIPSFFSFIVKNPS
ncbi:hypothetical protein L1887_14338 [Cichorium endivia]|nr:hypothetical protein L1887_14338 [Cichorium endivia]